MNATTIYNEIQASLKKGERVAVATVVKTVGAAPCGAGTKMLVHGDGTTYGTFSGPKIDARVAHDSRTTPHHCRRWLRLPGPIPPGNAARFSYRRRR